MPAATANTAAGIGSLITQEAVRRGGSTWNSIQQAAPLYIRGYAQTLVEIAKGVARGEISNAKAKMYVRNAHLLLVMGIANVAQIVLVQVQAVRTSINGMLPIAVL
jgi:hypothetical protein